MHDGNASEVRLLGGAVQRGMEGVFLWVTRKGKLLKLRAAGIWQAQSPGHLVEGLARSVVPGMAEKPEPVVIQHFYYMAVTA